MTLILFSRLLTPCLTSKILDFLYYFSRKEAVPTSTSLFLSQHKYIQDLFKCFHMACVKVVATTISTVNTVMLNVGTPSVDASECK